MHIFLQYWLFLIGAMSGRKNISEEGNKKTKEKGIFFRGFTNVNTILFHFHPVVRIKRRERKERRIRVYGVVPAKSTKGRNFQFARHCEAKINYAAIISKSSN